MFFVKGQEGATPVTFDTEVYDPWAIKAEGFETSGIGTLPTPTLTVSDMGNLLTTLITNNEDLIGAKLRRITTWAKFLDGEPTADPTATLPVDTYILNKKMVHDTKAKIVQWQLTAITDQEGSKIPADQMVRDYCSNIYRKFNPTSGQLELDTSSNACPFADPVYFDENDDPTTLANDKCAKLKPSCHLRFGADAEIYFKGEPGLARLRVR